MKLNSQCNVRDVTGLNVLSVMKYYYDIAGFTLSIETDAQSLQHMPSFIPFVRESVPGKVDFKIVQKDTLYDFTKAGKIGTYQWFQAVCTLYRMNDQYIWNRVDTVSGKIDQVVWHGYEPRVFKMYLSNYMPHVLEHLVLIAFNYAVLPHNALILHSSVVELENQAYLFLGESGTGKSTHTKLWVKYLPESKILNDDGPIIRVCEGKVFAFGSPWSGKGRVFRNVGIPVNGIYRLSQAPYNKLTVLGIPGAFSSLVPSCLPVVMQVERHADMAFNILSNVIMLTRQFHLDCLPDAKAAYLSHSQKCL
ncbi:MAG: hypothetical protein RR555_07365 [Bacteroidales bacterium]